MKHTQPKEELTPPSHRVPSNYSCIIARELGLLEHELSLLLQDTGLKPDILTPGNNSSISADQQMRILENAQHLANNPAIGLHIGQQLHPASHGPIGYLVLSSHDVLEALKSFAEFLPLRFPFSNVNVRQEVDCISCTLELEISPSDSVQRILQECFALMLQSIVETVLGRTLSEAIIDLQHPAPDYEDVYQNFFHAKVNFSQPSSTFKIPTSLASQTNIAGHSDSYTAAHNLCGQLLEALPTAKASMTDQVKSLILSSPMGSLSADDVAQSLYVTKRTLQRRLQREGSDYRSLLKQIQSELAAHHLLDDSMTVEAIAALLGYYDTAGFRKAFKQWYGQSPSDYRKNHSDKLLHNNTH